MSVRAKCKARFEKQTGLKDVKFFVERDMLQSDDDFFQFLNRFDEAIESGKVTQLEKWNRDGPTEVVGELEGLLKS